MNRERWSAALSALRKEVHRKKKKIAAVSVLQVREKGANEENIPELSRQIALYLHMCTGIYRQGDRLCLWITTTMSRLEAMPANINEGAMLFNVIYTKQLGEQQLRD